MAPGSASKEVRTTAMRSRHSCEASVTSSASRAALVVLYLCVGARRVVEGVETR